MEIDMAALAVRTRKSASGQARAWIEMQFLRSFFSLFFFLPRLTRDKQIARIRGMFASARASGVS